MKNIMIALTALIISIPSMASNEPIDQLDKQTVKEMTTDEMNERMVVLESRLSEIQSMELDSLNRSERKDMKQEVRYINKEMKALSNGGIYLSTGALVVIIILLIIL